MRACSRISIQTASAALWAVSAWAQLDPAVWKTDVSRASIALGELHVSVAKDQIRAIDHPRFLSVEQAAPALDPREPVIVFAGAEPARAYPIRILLFHEIVNDVAGSTPIAVTFCPLCNTGLIFDRRVRGETLQFGVAGLLRKSDMIMHDRATESLWQQASGEALVGRYTGERLKLLGGASVPFGEFRDAHRDGLVLSPDAVSGAPYGISHYVGYEHGDRPRGPPLPGVLDAKERVLAILIDGRVVAHPFRDLARWLTVEGKLGGVRYVAFHERSMLSAMDQHNLTDSRAVGSAAAYSPVLDGRRLKFRRDGDRIVDKETGSRWNVLGRCIEGPLQGKQLAPVLSTVAFAFAIREFYPNVRFAGGDPGLDAPLPGPPGLAERPR